MKPTSQDIETRLPRSPGGEVGDEEAERLTALEHLERWHGASVR